MNEKVAILNDSHWGVRNNSVIFLDYMLTWYKEVFFPKCKEENVSMILHCGDLFDNRTQANVRMINYFNKFVGLLEQYNITMHVIIGNHDTFYRESNELNTPDILSESDYIVTYSKPQDFYLGDTLVSIVPWINKENYDETIKYMNETKSKYVFGHFEIAGMKMYKNSVCDDGLDAELLKQFDHVWSGHFHHHSTTGNITYLGADFHFTWQDYDDWRGFHILDTTTMTLEAFENEHCLFNRIGYNDSIVDYTTINVKQYEGLFIELVVVEKNNEVRYDDFINRINSIHTHDFNIIDQTILVNDIDIVDDNVKVSDTLELIINYSNSIVEDEDDKKQTKSILQNLYKDAMNVGV